MNRSKWGMPWHRSFFKCRVCGELQRRDSGDRYEVGEEAFLICGCTIRESVKHVAITEFEYRVLQAKEKAGVDNR